MTQIANKQINYKTNDKNILHLCTVVYCRLQQLGFIGNVVSVWIF